MSQISLILQSIFLTLLVSSVKCKCPNSQWVDASAYGLGCLRFELENSMTWLEAQDFCLNKGAHLVEVLNDVQQAYLENKGYEYEQATNIGRDWWLGLTDEGYEGRYLWIHSLKIAEYFYWHSSQPNGDIRSNFVLMHKTLEGFKWFDYPNDHSEHSFAVCQLNA